MFTTAPVPEQSRAEQSTALSPQNHNPVPVFETQSAEGPCGPN